MAQDRFKNSIEFETVRNSLSNPYVYIYIYIFTGFERNFIAYVSSTNFSTSNSLYFIISPEMLDLTTLEIAIVISI